MAKVLGIDIGTTNSCMSAIEAGGTSGIEHEPYDTNDTVEGEFREA